MTQRTILLTGASGRFGKILTRHFLAAGDLVIGTARSAESMARMRDDYAGQRFEAVLADLADVDAAARLCSELAARGLAPDCLVNNARSLAFLKVKDNGIVSRENFVNEYLMDVVVPYELTMAIATQPGSRLTRVVNIGSQYGSAAFNLSLYDRPDHQAPLHYGVAKAALVQLTKELAVRLAPREIKVNCVAFGGVDGRVDEAFKERYAKLCPTGRMLNEDEVPGPVDMLLSQAAGGITGHTIKADGGWTLW